MGGDLEPVPHVKRPHSFGAVNFVRRHAQQVDAPTLYVDLFEPERLYGVAKEEGVGALQQVADGGDVGAHAGLVVDGHEGDQDGVGAEGVGDLSNGDFAALVGRQVSDFVTLRFQNPTGAQHRRVF